MIPLFNWKKEANFEMRKSPFSNGVFSAFSLFLDNSLAEVDQKLPLRY